MTDCRCGLPRGIRVPKPSAFVVPCEEAEGYVKDSVIKQTLYHGSAVVDKIVSEGFKVDAPRARDPGDFGWGIYLSDSTGRAFSAGGMDVRRGQERVVAIKVDVRNPLRLKCPYPVCDLPATAGDRLIWGLREKHGDTVHGLSQEEADRLYYKEGKTVEEIACIASQNRVKAAKKWTEEIQKAGYDAVVWERGEEWPGGHIEHEVVIFDPSKIKIIGSRCEG